MSRRRRRRDEGRNKLVTQRRDFSTGDNWIIGKISLST